jgi:carbon-monoxide dehydrogenase medium subunit
VKPPKFLYHRASSLQDALAVLSESGAQPIAGGQSLVPTMNLRLAGPEKLVDLGAIAELRGIHLERTASSVAP